MGFVDGWVTPFEAFFSNPASAASLLDISREEATFLFLNVALDTVLM